MPPPLAPSYQKKQKKGVDITATIYEVDLIKQSTTNKLTTDLLLQIHNIYSSNSYCKEDKCMKETYGYNCDDCLYQSIQALIWQLKFNNATKETNSPKEEAKEEARKKKEEAIMLTEEVEEEAIEQPIKQAKEEDLITEGDIKNCQLNQLN